MLHFITYGDNKFINSKNRLLKEAREFNEFKTVTSYGPEDLSQEFKQKHKDILKCSRGGGYWIWRPYILKKKIDTVLEGDFVIYLDAGCTLNPKGKQKFHEYINKLGESEYGMLSFQMSGNNGFGDIQKEKWWTTKEIFKYFEISLNNKIAESGQYLGGIFIMKKNDHLMKLLDIMLKSVEDIPKLFTDEYNGNQLSYFQENRHEQSITSMIRKIYGSVVIDGDETWCIPFGGEKSLEYPFWATRLRS